MELKVYIFLWLSCGIVLIGLRIVHDWIGLRSSPVKYNLKDPIFGLDEIWTSTQAAKCHTSIARIRQLYEHYGYTFSCQPLAFSAVNTIEPENFEAVLITRFKHYKISSPRLDALSPLRGRSILLSDGAEWELSRALHRPSFSKNQIGDFTSLEKHVQNLFRILPRDQSIVDLAPFFFRLTADAKTDLYRFTAALHNAQLGGERRARFGRLARLLPQRDFWHGVKQAHDFIDELVERAIKHRTFVAAREKQEAIHEEKATKRYIFLRELSKLTEDREVLREELLTIFLIGRDATASLIFISFLCSCSESRHYATTLRLYPVAPTNSRVASKDTILPLGGGADGRSSVFVSKGTIVLLRIAALHRRPDLWGKDANEFRPERWEEESEERRLW
ncbi:hypothetical protein MMC12_004280, partial [Toensbergia leucococca]|nr:hypothetical protein [Toensbergia leucococca]